MQVLRLKSAESRRKSNIEKKLCLKHLAETLGHRR